MTMARRRKHITAIIVALVVLPVMALRLGANSEAAPTTYTHVIENGRGLITLIGSRFDQDEFACRLRQFNGEDRFALILEALPEGMEYDQAVAAGQYGLEYLQAAGRADQMTVEIRKPGGQQWGADWVRYVVGHPHEGPAPLDVPIVLPLSTEMISAPEVFDAEEAADLFYTYYTTGDIPAEYTLRPAQAFARDGAIIDPRNS